MSTSDIYILNNKSTRWVAEFRNGWGSGPCLWDHLASKYFPDINFNEYDKINYVGWDRKNRMVWDLAYSENISEPEKTALMITFDKSYIPTKKLEAAGDACIKTFEMIESHGFWNGVNHWKDFGIKFKEMSSWKFHKMARGVVLNCTSVADMWIQPNDEYLKNAWSIYE